jgi:hypothetical protein
MIHHPFSSTHESDEKRECIRVELALGLAYSSEFKGEIIPEITPVIRSIWSTEIGLPFLFTDSSGFRISAESTIPWIIWSAEGGSTKVTSNINNVKKTGRQVEMI